MENPQCEVLKALGLTANDQGSPGQEVIIDRKLKESSSIFRNRRAGSLARLGHLLDVQKIAGSNPARPTQLSLEKNLD